MANWSLGKLTNFSESESLWVLSDSLRPHGLYSPWNSLGPNTGVGSLSLLQGIFPTQGSNPGLLHCKQILYQLSHKGSSALNANSLRSWWKPAAWQPPEGAEMGQASCTALFPDNVPRSLFVLSGSSLEDPLGWLSPTDLTQFEILFPWWHLVRTPRGTNWIQQYIKGIIPSNT